MTEKHHVKVRSLNAAGTFAGGAFWPARSDVEAHVDGALLGCLKAHPHLAVTDVANSEPVEAATGDTSPSATVTPIRKQRR